jgi:hypothetical protein
MNTLDILKYGHATLLKTIDGLNEDEWHTAGVCGRWSPKDIVAHLASYEQVLVEILDNLVNEKEETPTLDHFREAYETFNDEEVERRKEQSAAQTVAEYEEAHAGVMALAKQVAAPTWRENGILPWYGSQYDLDDFIVYTYYGHKREHSAQIAALRDRLSAANDSK